MLKKLFALLILFVPQTILAQNNVEKEYETLFAWEVKQIDEFIERFNDTDKTLIKEYNQKHNTANPLTREKLIKSLFNAARTDWNFADITTFIKQVNNKTNPLYLDFDKGDWYAEVTCASTLAGKSQNILLKLQINRQVDGSSKWVISDVKFADSKTIDKNIEQPVLPVSPNKQAMLNPMSHATDFLNIDMVSKNPKDLGNYIEPGNHYSNELCYFVNQCLNNNLKIIKANSITYHFLQIKGWELQIQQYNRSTKNSGWLINELIKLPS